MSVRFRILDDSRPNRQRLAGLKASGRGRFARRPTVEALEGRALLSTGGSPDFTYGADNNPNYPPGFTQVIYNNSNMANFTVGEALQPDGKLVVVGYQRTDSVFGAAVGNVTVERLNAAGLPDPTFGTQGSVILPGPTGLNEGVAVAFQPNGDIVVLGNLTTPAAGSPTEIVLYRLSPDGTPDPTFGAAGAVVFNFDQGTTPLDSTATTLAIQPDGKIVVGGAADTNGVVLARFNPNGTPDLTFGASGQALVGITSGATTLADTQGVAGLAIQADGAIDYDTTVLPASEAGLQIAVGQLTAAGTPDTTFGTGGQVILSGSSADTAGALAIQPNGQLVVAGAFYGYVAAFTIETHFDVYRLDVDGAVDTTFGVMGEATAAAITSLSPMGSVTPPVQDLVNSVVVQPDGKIVVGGSNNLDYSGTEQAPALARLDADGSPDLTFGTGGVNNLIAGYGGSSDTIDVTHTVYSMALQPDGKILIATGHGVGRLLGFGSSNDFDEDGTTDPAVLLPNFAYPIFAYRPSSGGADVLEAFGTPGAGQTLPAPGAYQGGGVNELGVYLPAIGAFAYRPITATKYGNLDQFDYIGLKGAGQSIPADADYTGSGITDPAVYEPSNGSFVYQVTEPTGFVHNVTVPLGTSGVGNSIPAPADYFGTGQDDFAVYEPATASFVVLDPVNGQTYTVPFGMPGAGNSIPVPGDYDASGHTELAVYLPTLGAFAYRPYDGGPDQIIGFGTPGAGNSIPVPGDYDGSGHTELAVYLPTLGALAYRPYGTDGSDDQIIGFGQPGAGNTVPFNAAGAESVENGNGDGGGSGSPSVKMAGGLDGYVDFVPDLAGQPAKKGDAASTITSIRGQS